MAMEMGMEMGMKMGGDKGIPLQYINLDDGNTKTCPSGNLLVLV